MRDRRHLSRQQQHDDQRRLRTTTTTSSMLTLWQLPPPPRKNLADSGGRGCVGESSAIVVSRRDNNNNNDSRRWAIDDTGKGIFQIATRSAKSLPSSSSEKTATKSSSSLLTFHIQIDEPTQHYLVHTSMGRLDKIRELHPGVNILLTLSTWNEMQK